MTKPFVRPDLQQLLDTINGMNAPSFPKSGLLPRARR